MTLYEEISRLQEIMQVDEMAYPVEFDFEEFRKIGSFAGRIKYAQSKLLGKVGRGSGRAVFRVDDEKVLKVAVNHLGVAQNEAETDWGTQEYDVVAKVFEFDPENTWLEMEIAKKTTLPRFQEITGVPFRELTQWLFYIDNYNDKMPREQQDKMRGNEFVQNLTMFIQDYGYPIPGDFIKPNTYGEVLRDGRPAIVVIDFGYNSNTSDVYQAYKRKRIQRY